MPASVPRRQAMVLAVLGTGLIVVLAYQWWSSRPGRVATGAATTRDAAARGGRKDDEPRPVPELRVAALSTARPEPAENGRNLFREKPKAPPPAPPRVFTLPPPPDPNAPPPAPPPPPPIPLRFIGTVKVRGQTIAVLSDSNRDVIYGREGEIVEGRYRIVRIGVESVVMAYADGRGERRIPLSAK